MAPMVSIAEHIYLGPPRGPTQRGAAGGGAAGGAAAEVGRPAVSNGRPALDHLDHLGPSSPLLTSPWLQLYLFHTGAAGPPSLVLRRGTRLRAIPRSLRGYADVALTPWGGETAHVKTSSLLSVACDMLLRAPLLLQAHPPSLNLP